MHFNIKAKHQNKRFSRLIAELLGDDKINIIDGGARNKTWELPGIASLCDVYGFEPNMVEYEKIISSTTDIDLVRTDLKDLPYHSISYINKALSDQEGVSAMKITRSPGACSLLEPNMDLISPMEYYLPNKKKFAPQFEIERQVNVETSTLDRIAQKNGIGYMDYIKLDTQGNELEILKGADQLFSEKRIGVLKSEVEFHELYKGQGLFSDIDEYLRSKGYMLLNLEFDSRHRVIWSGQRLKWDQGTLLWGDAFYALSPNHHDSLTDKQILRHSVVLAELGYVDYALSLLNKIKQISPEKKEIIATHYQTDKRTLKKRIKGWMKRRFFYG